MKIIERTDLSLAEATSVVIGHGIGAGILSVPYLAAHNSFREVCIIILFCALFNIVLHLLIAELSLNNQGAQFVVCFNNELFFGKWKAVFTWITFVLMGLSQIINVSAYLTGAAAVFESWFGLNRTLGMLLFYVLCSGVVYVGLKFVGICEKFAVGAMVVVVFLLLGATLSGSTCPMNTMWQGWNNALALFGAVSFSLSSVMSTPLVVKGLKGDAKRVRTAVIAGVLINASIVSLVTLTTLLGAGTQVTEDGALVDLARCLGGWVSVIGYVFTLLALATSFWSTTLNLRDIVSEQMHLSRNVCWLAASLPPLAFALLSLSSFVGLSRLAGVITVVTTLGIILAFNKSRKRVGCSPMLGSLGALPFQLTVLLCSLAATVGSLMSVT